MAILAACVDEMFAFGHFTHFVFHEMTDGKDGFLQLPTINLREEIGLIFHRVRTCCEPFAAVNPFGLRIMSGGNEGIIVAHFLVESAKFDEPIAHHVGIGRVAGAHLFHGVARHLVPIFAVAIYDFELAAIALSHGCRHLHILFAVAIPFALLLGTNLDVEAIGLHTMAHQLVEHHTAVDTAREEQCNGLRSECVIIDFRCMRHCFLLVC